MSKAYLFLFLGLVNFSCQIATERDFGRDSTDNRYNLTADRTKFDELRKGTPEQVKKTNDEKALILEWMADYKREPSDIRDKFSTLVHKKRERFNDDLNKIREEYSNNEKKQREKFLKDLDEERSEIKEKKLSREKTNDLFSEIDIKRKEFFSKSKDDRDGFEADYRQKRKDFEEYLREKTDDFNSEMKAYTEKYNQLKKQLNTH